MTPTFPKLKWPWSRDSFDALQKWIDQVRDVFAHNIAFSENLACDVVVIEFKAGTVPSKLVSNATRPLGVLQFDLQQIDPASNAAPTVADSFSWTFDPKTRSLVLPTYGTIGGTARYRATLLVVRS